MLSNALKLSAIALSSALVIACVPDPWPGTIQFGESGQYKPKAVHHLSSGDIISVTNDGVLYRISSAGDVLWSSALPVDQFSVTRMVMDSDENGYIIGTYDEGSYPSTIRSSVILKVSNEGETIWARHFTCPDSFVEATDVEIGSNNTMYAQFGVGCESFLGTGRQGEMDNVILQMDSGTGDVLWTWREGEPGGFMDSYTGGLVFTHSGELISINTLTILTMESQVTRIQKFSIAGELLNEQSLAYQLIPFGKAAVDSEDNLYLSGSILGSEFYDQPLIGEVDAGLLKMDPEFNVLWARVIGTISIDYADANIVLDDSGSLYIGGGTSGAMPANQHQGQKDAFVSKWSTDGLHQWSVQIGSEGNDSTESIALSNEGGIFIAGITRGQLVPDAEAHQALFISKLKADGTIISKPSK